ncbi:MAG TPA: hypothetical protein VFT13_06770 [Candidatus Krumholzibacteria bacterium]|nr:hypothetical protein [Candidatus Krumholzibacteria bacterium]
MRRNRLATAALATALLLPALASGEVVRLRDGSSINGRLIAVDGDSLTFRLSAGPRVKFHREQVLAISFDESPGAALGAGPAAGGAAVPAAPVTGTIAVSFKDKRISSKISVDKKKDWDAHVRSNHIVVQLIVNGEAVYTAVDSTMDKTIYKGHITQLRNDASLEDFRVEVPAGTHQCEVVIRNLDDETFRDDFDPEPLHAVLALDQFEVRAGVGGRIEVGIDKGTMKLGKAKLYRVE